MIRPDLSEVIYLTLLGAEDSLEGLSHQEMSELICKPFDNKHSPMLLNDNFNEKIAEKTYIFSSILKYMELFMKTKKIRLTAKGNLPVKFCRELIEHDFLKKDDICYKYYKDNNLPSEECIPHISKIKNFTNVMGLVKKNSNYLILTDKYNKLLKNKTKAQFLTFIFKEYGQKYVLKHNRNYLLVHGTFSFLLYLLHKYGSKKQKSSFYIEKILKAFPKVLVRYTNNEYIYLLNVLVLRGYLEDFGLVNVSEIDSSFSLDKDYYVEKTAFFDEFIKFQKVNG